MGSKTYPLAPVTPLRHIDDEEDFLPVGNVEATRRPRYSQDATAAGLRHHRRSLFRGQTGVF
jgi:hypothetical protein